MWLEGVVIESQEKGIFFSFVLIKRRKGKNFLYIDVKNDFMDLKEWFKYNIYWLKSGLILLILYILIVLLAKSISDSTWGDMSIAPFFLAISFPFGIMIEIFLINSKFGEINFIILMALFNGAGYFLIGALFGYLREKFKDYSLLKKSIFNFIISIILVAIIYFLNYFLRN